MKDLKLFRILVILKLPSTVFLNRARFINQLLVCLFQAQVDCIYWDDSPQKFS